jgi:tetratricopeptide (TPR) repeat protein
MKILLTLLILSSATITSYSQQISWQEWEEESKTNIRLLPQYGLVEKTEGQLAADEKFIETILSQGYTRKSASAHFIRLGFDYLYPDVKTAMYRFNQAYLLDSANVDIYWGYGGVYMVLGNYQKAKEQYEKGLALDPDNTNLLTDYGTYYMAQYFALDPIDKELAQQNYATAIKYLSKSYRLDPNNQNTTFKLAVLYLVKEDCPNALRFYNECVADGGQPLSEEFTKNIMEKCKE